MADPPVEIKIRGVRQLQSGARRLFSNIETAEPRDAIRPTVEQVTATVRGRVPVVSGRLQGSVRGYMVGSVGKATMGAGLPYARWIEFGGGRGRPYKPRGRFMYPTAKRTERAFRKHAESVCAREIGRMTWPTPK